MLAELISAGANLFGNLFNKSSQEKINAQNIAAQQQMNAQNIALQKEFAQHGIRWKVADAQAAGLHPLAAMGAQTTSFSPLSVGAGAEAPKMDFSALGQDLSRAAKAMASQEERQAVDQEKERKLDLESKALDNDLKRSTLASRHISTSRFGGQLGPPLPRPGPTRTPGGIAVSEDDLKQKAEDFPGTKVVRPFGYPLLANPYFNDGQQFEDRYGDSEIGSTVKFGINTLADHYYTGLDWASRNYDRIGRFLKRPIFGRR